MIAPSQLYDDAQPAIDDADRSAPFANHTDPPSERQRIFFTEPSPAVKRFPFSGLGTAERLST